MGNEIRFSQLKPGQRRLVRLMCEMGFGRIEGLIVHGGEPVFVPAPRIIREIKLEPEPGGRSDPLPADYVLKSRTKRLLERLADLSDGRIETLFIADGLPVRMTVEGQDVEKR